MNKLEEAKEMIKYPLMSANDQKICKWLIEKLEAAIEELNRCTHCEVLGVSKCGCLDKAKVFLESMK